MKKESLYKRLDIIFVSVLIIIFFLYYFDKISYGLPYFVNLDEIEFQSSVLSSLGFLTGYFELNYNPFYAPLINLILILKFVFINDFLFNSLSIDQIRSKIYFNPELFIFYGRLASLIITSFSIFFLYLVFKKLKINFLIYSVLLITFTSSLVVFNVSTIMSKNSCNLLIFIIQLYFLIKYLFKIDKFNFKSYLIFSLLGSLAWGINYWPAFISLYSIFILHLIKFRFLKIHYLIIFLIIFIIFGPFINSFFVNMGALDHIVYLDDQEKMIKFEISFFIKNFIENIISSLKIIYHTDKNILLLIVTLPIFLINKNAQLKKEFLIILLLVIGPILIFGISGNFVPQLRYFAGIISVILVLTALMINELNKNNLKYFSIFLIIFNFYFIYANIKNNIKITNILSNNHTFMNFNKKINNLGIDNSKILYLVDLNFQESLKQNLYYIELYENEIIKKNESSKKFIENIKNKISKIKNTNNIKIENKTLKNDITYFNYNYFPPKNLKLFFDFIKKDFDFVVIEESTPFYLSDRALQKNIKNYVKEKFVLNHIQYDEDKIFLRSQQSIIHYFTNTLSIYDFATNIDNKKLEVIYGTNFSLYKLN